MLNVKSSDTCIDGHYINEACQTGPLEYKDCICIADSIYVSKLNKHLQYSLIYLIHNATGGLISDLKKKYG